MQSREFKEALIALLQQAGGLPYLFVGSGLSRRYLGIGNWVELLSHFASANSKSYYEYSASIDADRLSNPSLHLPAVATAIARDFVPHFFNDDVFSSSRDRFLHISGQADMPLKIAVSDYISSFKLNLELLDDIRRQEIELLSNTKIRGIITTNYDTLLEDLFPKFTSFIGQNDLITSQLTLVHDIYKIHGSVSDPASIILTLNDYEKFLEINKYLVSKILTIFVENPIIFLGYSVSDHNIQTVITDIIGITKNRNDIKDKIKDRMIIVEWHNDVSEPLIERITKTVLGVEVPMTVIKVPDFIDIFQTFSDLTEIIPQSVLKYVLQNMFLLQNQVDPEDINRPVLLVDKDSYTDENLDSLEIVIGFGVKEKIRVNAKGYGGVSLDELLDDIVDNGLIKTGYNSEKLLTDTIETDYTASLYSFVPLCKHLRLSGRFDKADPFHGIPRTKELYDRTAGLDGYKRYYSSPPSTKRKTALSSYLDFTSYISGATLDNNFVHDIFTFIEDRGEDFIDTKKLETFLAFQSPAFTNLASGYKSKLLCALDKLKYGPREPKTID